MDVQVTRKLFTTTEYDQMIAAGIFDENDRVELVGGEIVEMSPIGMRHAACVKRINQILVVHLSGKAIIGVQDPIHLDELSEPEPDVTILRLRDDYYAQHHPTPEDIFLLIEVAETSVGYDRTVKIPRFAAAGIPEVWLVDVDAEIVTVFQQPAEAGYSKTAVYHPTDTLSPTAFPDLQIAVKDILG